MATELKGSVSKGITDTIVVSKGEYIKTIGMEIEISTRNDDVEPVTFAEDDHNFDAFY